MRRPLSLLLSLVLACPAIPPQAWAARSEVADAKQTAPPPTIQLAALLQYSLHLNPQTGTQPGLALNLGGEIVQLHPRELSTALPGDEIAKLEFLARRLRQLEPETVAPAAAANLPPALPASALTVAQALEPATQAIAGLSQDRLDHLSQEELRQLAAQIMDGVKLRAQTAAAPAADVPVAGATLSDAARLKPHAKSAPKAASLPPSTPNSLQLQPEAKSRALSRLVELGKGIATGFARRMGIGAAPIPMAPIPAAGEGFYDPGNGFRLDLYVALIQHVLDQKPQARAAYLKRVHEALKSSPEALARELQAIAAERTRAGFPFEPARLDTVLSRQSGSVYQSVVELVNNGFDAMGDAIGRFGVGVYQAVGWLEEGESLSYRGVSKDDPRRAYWARFHKAQGRLWIEIGADKLGREEPPGTEVRLSKKNPIDKAKLDEYLVRKLAQSRRGRILKDGQVLNDLAAYRTTRGAPTVYRLGEGSVTLEITKRGREIVVRDSGRGLTPQVVTEALPVPGVSTNRSNTDLAQALARGDKTANGEGITYKPGPGASRGKAIFQVGGTEVETLDLQGEGLAPEIVLDLPTGSYQKEARAQIVLDEPTVTVIKRLIDETIVEFKTEPARVAPIINSLAAAMALLQDSHRVKSLRRDDDLFDYLYQRVSAAVSGMDQSKFVVLPAGSESMGLEAEALAGRTPVALDAQLWDFDPASVGGELLPGSGKSVWSVRMRKVYQRVGKRLLLLSRRVTDVNRRKALEGEPSVLLNLILGVWLGYGDRPPPEAALLGRAAPKNETEPIRSGAIYQNEAQREFFNQNHFFFTYQSSRLLDRGETVEGIEEVLRPKLHRILEVFSMFPGLPLDAASSLFSFSYGAADLSFVSDRFIVTRSDKLYEIKDGAMRRLRGFRDGDVQQSVEKLGDSAFVTARHARPRQEIAFYEIKDGRAERIQDLGVEHNWVYMANGRRFVKGFDGSPGWSIFEIRDGKAMMLSELSNKEWVSRPLEEGQTTLFWVLEWDGSYVLYADEGEGFKQRTKLPRDFKAVPLFDDGRRVFVQSVNPVRICELKEKGPEMIQGLDRVLHIEWFKVVEGRPFVGGSDDKGQLVQYEIRGGRAERFHQLNWKRWFERPVGAGGRLFFEADGHVFEIKAAGIDDLLYGLNKGDLRQPVGDDKLVFFTMKMDPSPQFSLFMAKPGHMPAVMGLTNLAALELARSKDGHVIALFRREKESPRWCAEDLTAPLSHVSGNPLPRQAFKIKAPSNMNDEERFQLAANLVRVNWRGEKFERLGWALPHASVALLDRLDKTNQDALNSDIKGLLVGAHREIFPFLAGVDEALTDDKTFNRVISRWLLIFKADPLRALDLAERLENHYDEFAEKSTEQTPPLISFLRGETNFEPLKELAEEAAGRKLLGPTLSGLPVSALAGARANLAVVRGKGHGLTIADLAGQLPAEGYPQTEKTIERAQGAEAGYEWVREGVQNGIKASERAGVAPKVEISAGVRQDGDKSQLIVSVRDRGTGMDVYDILHDLLPLDRSSFSSGQDASLGFNGRGWYKFFVRSDRLRVTTGKRGAGRHTELEVRKERLPGGGFRWQVEGFRELEGEFEGTRMNWVQERPGHLEDNRLMMELEAALIGDSLETYVGTMGERGVAINYNGRSILEKVRELGSVQWAPGQKVRVIETSSRKRRTLEPGFFVMDLEQDPDVWALVPEELRKFMRGQGLSLELPTSQEMHPYSIVLDRDRSGLAEKERYMARLQKVVLAAVSQAAALAVAEGRWKPRGLPADYAYRSEHLWENNDELQRLGKALADSLKPTAWDGLTESALSALLGPGSSEAALAHFIAAVEFPWDGGIMSLFALREKIMSHLRGKAEKEPDMASLPSGFKAAAGEALGRYRDLASATAAQDNWATEDLSRLTPDQRRSRELLAGLISEIMSPLVQKRFHDPDRKYRVSFGRSDYSRLARYGKDWISLNAPGITGWLDWIGRAAQGQTSPKEDYDMLFKILEDVVHEDAHAWEPGTDETHNEAFQERMRSTLLELAELGVVPEDALRNMRSGLGERRK